MKFNAQAWMEDNGLTLQDATDKPNQVVVKTADGQLADLDLNLVMKKEGFDPAKTGVILNRVDSALDKVPEGIDATTRMKLSFAPNSESKVAFLKSKYKNVAVDKAGDLVVQDKGVWKRVDPDFFGMDGFDMAELGRDLAEAIPTAVDAAFSTVGRIAGGVIGAGSPIPGGTLMGQAAGAGAGQMVATQVNNLIGEAIGVSRIAPEELQKKMLFDGLIAAAGETVVPGIATLGSGVKKQLMKIGDTALAKKLGEGVAGLGNLASEGYVKLFSNAADVPEHIAHVALKDGKRLQTTLDVATKAVAGADGKATFPVIATKLAQQSRELVNEVVKDSQKVLSNNWNKSMNAIRKFQKGAELSTEAVAEHFDSFANAMVDTGLLARDAATGNWIPRTDRMVQVLKLDGLDSDVRFFTKEMKKLTNAFNYTQEAVKAPADALLEMTRKADDVIGDMVARLEDVHGPNTQTAEVMKQALEAFKDGVTNAMPKEIKEIATSAKLAYKVAKDDLRTLGIASGRVNNQTPIETILNKFTAAVGSQQGAKDALQRVAKLTGKEHELGQLYFTETAKGLANNFPGGVKSLVTGAAAGAGYGATSGGGVVGGVAGGLIGAATTLAASSPKAVFKAGNLAQSAGTKLRNGANTASTMLDYLGAYKDLKQAFYQGRMANPKLANEAFVIGMEQLLASAGQSFILAQELDNAERSK